MELVCVVVLLDIGDKLIEKSLQKQDWFMEGIKCERLRLFVR